MPTAAPPADVILRGGRLIDGSGAPATQADLAVRDGRILAIGRLDDLPAGHVIDCNGLLITPGFIDSHTHDDGYLLARPDMTPKVSQGVTTVVTGNCGISLAPLSRPDQPQPLDLLGPPALFRFPRFADWLGALREQPAAVNVIPLVGHTTLRADVMDTLDRPARPDEIDRMRAGVADALACGAFGLSSGTFYPPAAAAPTEELIQVCEPMAALGTGIYATHLRDESDDIMPAIEEALAIGRAARATVVFSHHKLAGERNHGRSAETLARISAAAAQQPVCLDCHPYPATSTMLRLDRVRLASRTLVTWSTPHPEAAGRDFAALAREWQLDDAALLARLSPAGAIYFLMHDGDIRRIFQHPLTMVGSDGLPFDPHPHPRQWGTFTQVLRRLVREQGVLSWEDAIHRMTGLPAQQYRLAERGLLRVGHHADLVVLAPDTVADRATFESPIQASAGIHSVWVNGQTVWRDGAATGRTPGAVLRPPHLRTG